MIHEQQVDQLFNRACAVLRMTKLSWRPMRNRGVKRGTTSYTLGHTNLSDKIVYLDLYTPRLRKPKSLNAILRVIAHEIAHYQKPPYRQRYKGHWIWRQHYPRFYKQVTKNIEKFKKDPKLGQYFRN